MNEPRIGMLGYLNSVPFFHDVAAWPGALEPGIPTDLGRRARAGELDAALFSLCDLLALYPRYVPLGTLGIAGPERAQSVVLWSRQPIDRLEGARIGVTTHTATSVHLLSLLLRHRYRLKQVEYTRTDDREGFRTAALPAVLVIGDQALRSLYREREAWQGEFPYRYDLGAEWRRWQGLPFVFARWGVRRDLPAGTRSQILRTVEDQLAQGLATPELLADRWAASGRELGLDPAGLVRYWHGFRYRFTAADERGQAVFTALLSQGSGKERFPCSER